MNGRRGSTAFEPEGVVVDPLGRPRQRDEGLLRGPGYRQAHTMDGAPLRRRAASRHYRVAYTLVAAIEAGICSVLWATGGYPLVTAAFIGGFGVLGWVVGRGHDQRAAR